MKQEMLAVQNKKGGIGDAAIRAVIAADQEREVQAARANRDLEVAGSGTPAASTAKRKFLKAQAEGNVIRMRYEAEAGVIADRVKAFGTGLNLARNVFYERVGPKIRSILSGDQADGLGGLLRAYVPAAAKGGAQ